MDIDKLLTEFSFDWATSSEVLDILLEPRLMKLMLPNKKEPTLTDVACKLHLENTKYRIVKYKDYSMLLEISPLNSKAAGIYEIHIACPKHSIIASRVLSLAAMLWAFQVGCPDITALTTNCPEGKIANMIRKLGAEYIYTAKVDGNLHFMLTLSALKSNLR